MRIHFRLFAFAILFIVSRASFLGKRNIWLHNYRNPENSERPSPFPPPKYAQLHGTTTVAFVHRDSVFIAVDSKASMGTYVGSRSVRKILPLTPNMVATMAGGAADCSFWIKRVLCEAKRQAYEQGVVDGRLRVKVFARMLARTIADVNREITNDDNKLSIGTMVAGWDEFDGASVFYVDSSGHCVSGNRFCVGSGALSAYGVLDDAWSQLSCDIPRNSGMTMSNSTASGGRQQKDDSEIVNSGDEEAVMLAVKVARNCIEQASCRDAFSGGSVHVWRVNSTGSYPLFGNYAV